MAAPFLPDVRDVRRTSAGGLTWVQLQLGGRWVDLHELSDGTIQIVLLATLFAFDDPFPILWVDEPELNLHPAWAEQVARRIVASRAARQIFVSTHSTERLDAITEEVMAGEVALFVVNAKAPGDSVVRLDAETLRGSVAEGWRLGDLYRAVDPRIGGWPW